MLDPFVTLQEAGFSKKPQGGADRLDGWSPELIASLDWARMSELARAMVAEAGCELVGSRVLPDGAHQALRPYAPMSVKLPVFELQQAGGELFRHMVITREPPLAIGCHRCSEKPALPVQDHRRKGLVEQRVHRTPTRPCVERGGKRQPPRQ